MTRLTTISIPFPERLMSTSRAPTAMPVNFAREIINMYVLKAGAGQKRNGVTAVGAALPEGTITTLMHYVDNAGVTQILACNTTGKIYLYENDAWTEKHTGLDTAGKIRWVHYAGKLIICNGVNNLLAWDGTSFTEVKEWVLEAGINLIYVSANSFTVEGSVEAYPVGRSVRFRLGTGVYVESTVQSVVDTVGTVTVTTVGNVLTVALDEAYYEEKPPPFSYIYAAHDRLWGFGAGALKAHVFSSTADQRNIVYYTYNTGDANAWRDAEGFMQYINIEDKMPNTDELVGMAVKDGFTVFFCSNNIQVWTGIDPTISGDFSWGKTIPLGAVHGNLIAEMPNDVAFFSRNGVRTLSRVLQTEQLDISDLGSEVSPSVASALDALLDSDAAYQNAVSFQYSKQNWFGFFLNGKCLVYQTEAASLGWVVFEGIFAEATAFLNVSGGDLYLSKGAQLYKYDESQQSDDGAAVATKWWTPWLNTSVEFKRWANKYVEVVSEKDDPIAVTLKRYKNYNNLSYVQYDTTLQESPDFWDSASWDEAYWDNISSGTEYIRDHFVTDVFSYAIESASATNSLTIYGLKFHGIQEK